EFLTSPTSPSNYTNLKLSIAPNVYTSGTYWQLMLVFNELNIGYVSITPKDTRLLGINVTEYNMLKGSLLTNPMNYDGNEITMFNKGIAIGDSLTEGVFNYTENGTPLTRPYPKYSYPTYLTKLTGVEM